MRQATITFKTKAVPLHTENGEVVESYKIPELKQHHCDMPAFRQHERYGYLANSQLFLGALRRISLELASSGWLRSDRLPANVQIKPGYLAVVTITV